MTAVKGHFGTVKMAEPKKQLRQNLESILYGYENGMTDYGEEEYPMMTLDEAYEYCASECFDILDNGHGHTVYAKGICDHLKFLGTDYIKSVIKEIADDCGILK